MKWLRMVGLGVWIIGSFAGTAVVLIACLRLLLLLSFAVALTKMYSTLPSAQALNFNL